MVPGASVLTLNYWGKTSWAKISSPPVIRLCESCVHMLIFVNCYRVDEMHMKQIKKFKKIHIAYTQTQNFRELSVIQSKISLLPQLITMQHGCSDFNFQRSNAATFSALRLRKKRSKMIMRLYLYSKFD